MMTTSETDNFIKTLEPFEKHIFHNAAQVALSSIIRNHQGNQRDDLAEVVVGGCFKVAAEYVKLTREYNL